MGLLHQVRRESSTCQDRGDVTQQRGALTLQKALFSIQTVSKRAGTSRWGGPQRPLLPSLPPPPPLPAAARSGRDAQAFMQHRHKAAICNRLSSLL